MYDKRIKHNNYYGTNYSRVENTKNALFLNHDLSTTSNYVSHISYTKIYHILIIIIITSFFNERVNLIALQILQITCYQEHDTYIASLNIKSMSAITYFQKIQISIQSLISGVFFLLQRLRLFVSKKGKIINFVLSMGNDA